ncbi:hypothetical protein FD754_013788 [Muntiacus muntjak]|uniref:RING-type E3 ubiquitin transferase n=1 Tax=Muntiacus muntjak TaxID=9888 RepID=A0A5N3VI41_MUNMU|nr:hypothetical protein FD754_013788 [Muntiacus muntjak]
MLSHSGAAVSEAASASQCVQTRLAGEASCFYSGDVHIQINSIPKECAENLSSRDITIRSGVYSCSHGCVHSQVWSHSHNEARQPDVTNIEPGDHRSSFSEFKYLFEGLQKSLSYILILGVKLVMQHITRIALGTGLLTTLIYANESIVNQVFLSKGCSEIQCVWLLVVLAGFSILSYYTFYSQSLHYILWFVGITGFILTFLFMGLKFWFHYLISYAEFSNIIRWILGIIIFRQVLPIFFTRPSYGVAASKRQCSDADDICSICQDEFQKTVISNHINKWKHGVTSSQL